ncbi:MAG: hypothetical protein A2277_21460, partial [Desulfobacterales bacterium RIFOXYA12_FULL_46_15]
MIFSLDICHKKFCITCFKGEYFFHKIARPKVLTARFGWFIFIAWFIVLHTENKIVHQHHVIKKRNKKNMNKVMGFKEWGLIGFLALIWGASFFFVKIAVATMTPLTVVACRVGLAALLLMAFALSTGRQLPRNIRTWGALFVLGALNNVIPFSLITWGQTHIDSGLAAILNATTPVFSVILAHFLTRDEPLTKNRLAGVLLGWTGVAVLMGIDSLHGIGMKTAGQAAVLGAAFLYSLAAIFGRRFRDIDPVVVATGMLTGSATIMIP